MAKLFYTSKGQDRDFQTRRSEMAEHHVLWIKHCFNWRHDFCILHDEDDVMEG